MDGQTLTRAAIPLQRRRRAIRPNPFVRSRLGAEPLTPNCASWDGRAPSLSGRPVLRRAWPFPPVALRPLAGALLACLAGAVVCAAQGTARGAGHSVLPACSGLKQGAPPPGAAGDASALRRHGVARAEIEVDATIRKDEPTDLRITRRLYFTAADGPDAVLVHSGLRIPSVDRAALRRAARAPTGFSLDGPRRPAASPYRAYILLWFFANPISFAHLHLETYSPIPRSNLAELYLAAEAGDLPVLAQELNRHLPKQVLNRALSYAISSPVDNSRAIAVLLKAGADANARYDFALYRSFTPLMQAVTSPCDLPALLAWGANRSARNSQGDTALDLARALGVQPAIRILEAAGRPR